MTISCYLENNCWKHNGKLKSSVKFSTDKKLIKMKLQPLEEVIDRDRSDTLGEIAISSL